MHCRCKYILYHILLGTHLEPSGIKYLSDVMTKPDSSNQEKYNCETNAKPSRITKDNQIMYDLPEKKNRIKYNIHLCDPSLFFI